MDPPLPGDEMMGGGRKPGAIAQELARAQASGEQAGTRWKTGPGVWVTVGLEQKWAWAM